MAKTIETLNDFSGGINSELDPRDLDEGGVVDARNVMCDVSGKVRQMGRDEHHNVLDKKLSSIGTTPGYGLYVYRTDKFITGNINHDSLDTLTASSYTSDEALVVAYQNANKIGFVDTEENIDLISLGTIEGLVKPAFYYSSMDGGLRICDSNYDNIVYDSFGEIDFSASNLYTRYFNHFNNKCWFSDIRFKNSETEATHYKYVKTHLPGYISGASDHVGYAGLHAYIYPPSVDPNYDLQSAADGTGTEAIYFNLQNQSNTTTETSPVSQLGTQSWNNMVCNNGSMYVHTDELASTGDSDWLASKYKFGMSFSYHGSSAYGDQESTVTNFDPDMGHTVTQDGKVIGFKLYVQTGSGAHLQSNSVHRQAFDPRITGCNLYLVGDSNGFYEDPYFLMEFNWGSTDITSTTSYAEGAPYILTSDGNRYEGADLICNQDGWIAPDEFIPIIKTPAITFSMRTGYSNQSQSTAINYKTAVVANGRCYAAGVRRWSFNVHNTDHGFNDNTGEVSAGIWHQPRIEPMQPFEDHDGIYVSPVGMFDIFPEENILNLGSHDGDRTIALTEYADRLFQYKKNKLYIINISEDVEYIESEHQFMGINETYQFIKINNGIAWINEYGCYFYDGNEVVDLTEGKILKSGRELNADNRDLDNMPSWDSFVGKTGGIGYIPKNQQLVIFNDPFSTFPSTYILIYDMKTESWTRGFDRIDARPKSNFVTNYDNGLMYGCLTNDSQREFHNIQNQPLNPGADEVWRLTNCNLNSIETTNGGALTTNTSQLKIGSNIIAEFSYPAGQLLGEDGLPTSSFREVAKTKILEYIGNPANGYTLPDNGTDSFEFEDAPDSLGMDNDLLIIRKRKNMDGTFIGGALSWTNDSSYDPPAESNSALTPSNDNSFFGNTTLQYIQPESELPGTDPFDVGVSYYGQTPQFWWPNKAATPYKSIINWQYDVLGTIPPPEIFMYMSNKALFSFGVNHQGGFDENNNDEPRIELTCQSGDEYTNLGVSGGDFTTFTIDLYSKELRNNILQYTGGNPQLSGVWNDLGGNCFTDTSSTFRTPNETWFWGQLGRRDNRYRFLSAFYKAVPKQAGSGEDTENGGSTACEPTEQGQHSLAVASANWPVGLFLPQYTINSFGELLDEKFDVIHILLSGDYKEYIHEGNYYTFSSDVGISTWNGKKIFIDSVDIISATGLNPNYIEQYPDHEWGSHAYITQLSISRATSVPGGMTSEQWEALDHWTNMTGFTLTVDGNTVAAIGDHSYGRFAGKAKHLFIPTYELSSDPTITEPDNLWTATISNGGITHSTSHIYAGFGLGHDANYFLYHIYKDFINAYELSTGQKPWHDIGPYQIPSIERLYTNAGEAVTTTALNNTSTTPFTALETSVRSGAVAEALSVGDYLLARLTAVTYAISTVPDWEMMKVTAISTAGVVTVIRCTSSAELESSHATNASITFSTASVTGSKIYWYKLRPIKQISATQFELYGGDYSNTFIENMQFEIGGRHTVKVDANNVAGLTGTYSFDHGTGALTGSGTSFSSQLQVGCNVSFQVQQAHPSHDLTRNDFIIRVTSITNDTTAEGFAIGQSMDYSNADIANMHPGLHTDGYMFQQKPSTIQADSENNANLLIVDSATYNEAANKTIVNIKSENIFGNYTDLPSNPTSLRSKNGEFSWNTPRLHAKQGDPETWSTDDVFPDNLGGNKPGFESNSVSLEDYTAPGNGLNSNAIAIKVNAIEMITNEQTNINTITNSSCWATDGFRLMKFYNNVLDGRAEESASELFNPTLITKEMALNDDIYSRKTTYEVSLTYKLLAGGINVWYAINGTNEWFPMVLREENQKNVIVNFEKLKSYQSIHRERTGIKARTGGWNTVSLGFNQSNGIIKNVKTIKFKIEATKGSYGFEINDISIVYRSLDAGRK